MLQLVGPCRRRNPRSVAAWWRCGGSDPRTLAQLSKSTRRSRPAILSALAGLVDCGWTERFDPATPTGAARPAMRFRLRTESGAVAGVNVGVHKMLVLVADLYERLVSEHGGDIADVSS